MATAWPHLFGRDQLGSFSRNGHYAANLHHLPVRKGICKAGRTTKNVWKAKKCKCFYDPRKVGGQKGIFPAKEYLNGLRKDGHQVIFSTSRSLIFAYYYKWHAGTVTSVGSGSENIGFGYPRLDNSRVWVYTGFNISYNFGFGFWPFGFYRFSGLKNSVKRAIFWNSSNFFQTLVWKLLFRLYGQIMKFFFFFQTLETFEADAIEMLPPPQQPFQSNGHAES